MSEPSWQEQSRAIHRWFSEAKPSIGIGKPSEIYFLALAMGGEVGELQNVVKKVWRGDWSLDGPDVKRMIANEIADIRIYMEHLADALGIDVDAACQQKIAELRERWPAAFPAAR